jgi:hypothetical protein
MIMKKTIVFLTLTCTSLGVYAQQEFKKLWETKASVNPKWNGRNDDLSKVVVGDLKELEMLDGNNGKTLWKFNVKEKLGVKALEDWFFLTDMEGDPLKLVYQKDKKDANNTIIYLNSSTGAIENSWQESNLKEKTGRQIGKRSRATFGTRAEDPTGETTVSVNYKDKLLKNSVSGNTFELRVNAFGKYTWSTDIKGRVVTHITRLMLSDEEPDIMLNVTVAENKVFVIYEGITALDLKTGAVLWNTTFDYVQSGTSSQEIGHAPMPYAYKDAVYICDLSKGEKAIKKLNINTGEVLWKGPKLDGDDVVSELFVSNNTLIAKFGGYIRKERSIYNPNGGNTNYKVKIDFEGKSDIRGYDVPTGKQKWNAENFQGDDKFSKSECRILADGNVYACTPKSFLIIDPSNGSSISKTELGKEIGKPKSIFKYDENYIVEGEEGLASYTSSGKKNYAVKTDKNIFSEFRGEAFIVWTGKNDEDMNEFIRFDLNSGKILGKQKGCYNPRFNTTGDYYIKFKDETIGKYSTK